MCKSDKHSGRCNDHTFSFFKKNNLDLHIKNLHKTQINKSDASEKRRCDETVTLGPAQTPANDKYAINSADIPPATNRWVNLPIRVRRRDNL